MSLMPLVNTHIVPPQFKNAIRRSRLRELGLSILSHRITTVVAPAGYGKSLWVSSLPDEPGWPSTAWLSLDSHLANPSYFLFHVTHALKTVFPGFGTQSLRTLKSLENLNRDWLIAASTIIEEVPHKNETVFVLDDFYLVEKNPVICSIIEYFIRWLPRNVHLVLISRNTPPLNLFRERLRDELNEIEAGHLLFTPGETAELLHLLGLKLSQEDIAAIHARVEGWPAGLRLVAELLRGTEGNLHATLQSLNKKGLYTYLGNELLGSLPQNLLDFFLDSALLPYLETELCDMSLQRNDSEKMLKSLHSHGLINRLDGDPVIWHLHHLMGEYLRHKATKVHSPERIALIQRRAAEYLKEKGDLDRALEMAVTCSDWPMAAEILCDNGDSYFLQYGRHDALYSWINRLPGDFVSTSPYLLYFMGMSSLHIDPANALGILSESANLAEKSGDLKCQIRSLLSMMAIFVLNNNTEKIKQTIQRIPMASITPEDPWAYGVVLVSSLGYAVAEDDLQKGMMLSHKAAGLKLEPEWRVYYLIYSSIIEYRLGNMAKAEEYIKEALELPFVNESDRWTGTVYEILSGIYGDGGHPETENICEELLRLSKKYNNPHQAAYAYRRLARLNLRRGNLAEARRQYEVSRSHWVETNNVLMPCATDIEILLLRCISGEDPVNLFPELQQPLETLLSVAPSQGYRDYALSGAGVIAREAGKLDLSLEWLEQSAANSSKKGAKQLLAGTLIHLARTHLLMGDDHKADDRLKQALGIAASLDLYNFWDWHPDTLYSMCRYALVKNIHPLWTTRFLCRYFPQQICEEAGSLLVHPDKSVRDQVASLLGDLTGNGTCIVHVNCLGEFSVFVNGVPIPGDRWKTQKAENLYKYLVANRRPQLKEKVIEALWPDSSPKSGDANLRMALTHVRKALSAGNPGSDVVLLKRGMIYINPDMKLFTDYELFSARAQSALQGSGKISLPALENLKRAQTLYRGPFLPDNLYDDWCINMRTRLQQLYLEALLKLAGIYLEQGEPDFALETYRRYAAVEPVDERVCRAAMELLWQRGEKKQALALYQDLSATLEHNLETHPSQELTALYEKIRNS